MGLLSPILAFFMASMGKDGWQRSALLDMERDAVAMAKQGYRIRSTQEYGLPLLGIVYYKVTYEPTDRA